VGEKGKSNGKSYMWTMAAVYGILGSILLGILLFSGRENILQMAFMAVIIGMLFFGFGASLYSLYGMGRGEAPDISQGDFVCKHCGKRFSHKKIWKLHQQSCVEMRM
jgi:hypothetical protein